MTILKQTETGVVPMSPEEETEFLAQQAAASAEAAKPKVPLVVSRAQAKLALLAFGLLDEVDAAIALLPDEQRRPAEIDWNDRATVERNSSLVLTLGPALGLDAGKLDELFIFAATL